MTSVTSAGCSASYLTPFEDPFTTLSPPPSYMYMEDGESFLFQDNELKEFSLIPPSYIQGREVIYTLDPSCKHAIYFKNKFIKRLDDFCNKIPSRDKEALCAIAQAAIFIITGKRDQVIPESVVEKEGVDLCFCVQDEKHLSHQVRIHNYPSSDSSIEEYSSSEEDDVQ